ncbi:MAG: hypothetical protein AAFX05_02025 [Planctomycetota bacterium]
MTRFGLILITLCTALATARQPETIAPDSAVDNLEQRLAALRPSDPMAYFELAEEVAYEMPHAPGQTLARQLFVLAFELDRRNGTSLQLGSSVCAALAELSTDIDEQRWLRALGASLQPDLDVPAWRTRVADSATDRAPLALAEALGAFRAGTYRDTRSTLARVDGVDVLRDAGMTSDEATRIINQVERIVNTGRQSRSRDGRVIRKVSDGRQTVELDPATGGNPGPSLTEVEFVDQLRAELFLLDGAPDAWGAQITLDNGRPLRDIDPDELAPYFDVDPDRPRWTIGADGAWETGRWQE